MLLDISRARPVPRGLIPWFPSRSPSHSTPRQLEKWREREASKGGKNWCQGRFELVRRGTSEMIINSSALGVFKNTGGSNTHHTDHTRSTLSLSIGRSIHLSAQRKRRSGQGHSMELASQCRPTGRWWAWPVHGQRFAPAFGAANRFHFSIRTS